MANASAKCTTSSPLPVPLPPPTAVSPFMTLLSLLRTSALCMPNSFFARTLTSVLPTRPEHLVQECISAAMGLASGPLAVAADVPKASPERVDSDPVPIPRIPAFLYRQFLPSIFRRDAPASGVGRVVRDLPDADMELVLRVYGTENRNGAVQNGIVQQPKKWHMFLRVALSGLFSYNSRIRSIFVSGNSCNPPVSLSIPSLIIVLILLSTSNYLVLSPLISSSI